MATPVTMRQQSTSSVKRKHQSDASLESLTSKKQRVAAGAGATAVIQQSSSPAIANNNPTTTNITSSSSSDTNSKIPDTRNTRTKNQNQTQTQNNNNASPYLPIYEPFVAKLRPSFEIKTMSVMSSTSINRHVTKALQHLGRFSSWDQSVLPGVILLTSKNSAGNKLITIAETVRRRIEEGRQKWFQYNIIKFTEEEIEAAGGEDVAFGDNGQEEEEDNEENGDSVLVEDTVMEIDGDERERREEDDSFETTQRREPPTIHERAVNPPKIRRKSFLTVFISRVPIDVLRDMGNVYLQTNEHDIDYARKKSMGVVA